MIDYHLAARPRGLESPEGDPEGVLDFWADDDCRPICQREYKWADDNGRQHGRPGVEVVQYAEALGAREIETNFLERFADRGRQEVGIGGLAAAAGECDLPRPYIADAHGAMDEERFDPFVAVMQNNGDGGRDHSSLKRDFSRTVVPQLPTRVRNCGHRSG